MGHNGKIAEIITWIHFTIMLVFGGVPFLIPLEVWPKRPLWHFIFLLGVSILGIVIATIYRKKYNIKGYHICFLNVISQRIKGYRWNDPRNYEYSHLKDILQRFRINISPLISLITLIGFTILTIINFIIYLS